MVISQFIVIIAWRDPCTTGEVEGHVHGSRTGNLPTGPRLDRVLSSMAQVHEAHPWVVNRTDRGLCTLVAMVANHKYLHIGVRLAKGGRDRPFSYEWPSVVGSDSDRDQRSVVRGLLDPADVSAIARLRESLAFVPDREKLADRFDRLSMPDAPRLVS